MMMMTLRCVGVRSGRKEREQTSKKGKSRDGSLLQRRQLSGKVSLRHERPSSLSQVRLQRRLGGVDLSLSTLETSSKGIDRFSARRSPPILRFPSRLLTLFIDCARFLRQFHDPRPLFSSLPFILSPSSHPFVPTLFHSLTAGSSISPESSSQVWFFS